jgi:hypothetical protein
MELWIRSQDRKRLTKATDIRIGYLNKIGWIIEDCDELGIYKTEERALEVLDEIQKKMTNKKGIITTQNKKGIDFIPFTDGIEVYEMPKE